MIEILNISINALPPFRGKNAIFHSVSARVLRSHRSKATLKIHLLQKPPVSPDMLYDLHVLVRLAQAHPVKGTLAKRLSPDIILYCEFS